MTLELFPSPGSAKPKRRKKKIQEIEVEAVTNEGVQLDWIRGLLEQIEFANNPDVLPDYILEFKVAKRRLEP